MLSCVARFSPLLCLRPDVNFSAQVVFKALLVLHSMIRSGATDNVLSFLGQQDLLRLRNVVGQTWDGEHSLSQLVCIS